MIDERDCQTAFDRNSLSKFSDIALALTPPPVTETENKIPPKSEEDEPKNT